MILSFRLSERRRAGARSCDARHTRTCYSVFTAMETHEELRPYLFAIAYRMLGSVAEAEDVVQDAFLRYHEAEIEADSPKAYLATITTRLAIDQLRSARARREVYPGEWLPEPLVDDEAVRHAETRGLALARVPAPAGEALAGRARGLPAPRGLRLPLRGGRRGSSTRAPTTAARSLPGRTGTSTRGGVASMSPVRSARRWRDASWPPGRRGTRRASSSCWPRMRPSTETVAARRRQCPCRSWAPSAWPRP